MDEYDKKFAEMQKYIPFLEAMIERLQNVKDKDNRHIQLQKMQSLHGILSNSKRKLKIETLQRCEDVLQKLYNRVEKGNTPGLQLPFKQNDGVTTLPSTSSEKAKSKRCMEPGHAQDVGKDKEIDETPESPDTIRSSSPDCQILPIIIPTERSELDRRRQKERPKEIPVITLTDNAKPDSTTDDVMVMTHAAPAEWDMLEESERTNSRNRGNWQPSVVTATSHDVATAAQLIGNSLPQRVNDSRNYTLDSQDIDIPTVPVPSLGGSRRLSSILEKNRLNLDIVAATSSSRSESPVNVPEVRLNSPDPEILFAKPRAATSPTRPRSKDSHNTPLKPPPTKPPSIPLLFSPPSLHEPPLSMEDLAELLNDGEKGDAGEKGDKANENAARQKDADKALKNLSLSERVKLTTRKNLPNTAGVSPVKSSERRASPHQSNNSQRSAAQSSFLGSKFQEPRYADNYERHPRQRDAHAHDSARDKVITISDDIPSQIPGFHNSANKPDERNVLLYQRRPSVVPSVPDPREDVNLSRPENEFMIDNTDYYNMHANQIHWASPTATTTDHQFGNTQWTPSPYGGVTNPPLQPTQHSFTRPPMEPQFRQNQFPPTLPANGPRPLAINPTVRPQEMSHMARPENVREDIPPLITPHNTGFSPQYRGFQMGQGSYDPAFPPASRPTEYPHVRPTWEGPANRISETTYENVIPCGIQVISESSTGTSYPRPNTPCPWGTQNRGNRSQGRDGYYDRNRTEVRPSFNRDVRRSDWSRDGHSDRENPNRFPNRDPRVRTEHNTSATQAKETGGASARDPRLAKDKHVNVNVNVSTKVKDTVHKEKEKDPKKRPVTTTTTKTTKEKPKSQKSPEKNKLLKDRMQSPLESLYGVIDTKVSQTSGLQKFKIPKIKRPEAPQPNRVANEAKKVESASSLKPSSRVKSSSKKSGKSSSKNKSKDVASAEVSSSSDGNRATEISVQQSDTAKDGKILSSSPEKSDKDETKIGEADSVTTNMSKSSDVAKKGKKAKKDKKDNKQDESEAADGSKSKEEVTQEWIEALIRKSFESGEGKKLVEQAKLIQKLGEALKQKKFKKLKKIIEAESESSSDKDETVETKKTKKKRRVIVSDSSDDECLAERLSILTTSTATTVEGEPAAQDSARSTDAKNSEEKLEATAASNKLSKKQTQDDIAKENDSLLETRGEDCVQVDNNKNKDVQLEKESRKNDRLEDNNENIDVQSESEKPVSRLEDVDEKKKRIEDCHDKSTVEKSKVSTESNIECFVDQNSTESIESLDRDKDRTMQSVATAITDQERSTDKPKVKTKRRNSLEMLQEDIREMFISEGVVMATGYRMCRLSKEGQQLPSSPSPLSMNSKKDEPLNIAEKKIAESNTETNESVAANKSRKSLRSRNIEESSKPKAKSKNDTRRTRSLRSLRKSIPSSDSEEDQPLALRTMLRNAGNSTPNQEVDRSEESNDTLRRRSKRVLRKDTVMEPRVLVEKADITKIDSSKIMFDSSSDESFGIDVSELAAAVDISLRPDKQSDRDSVDTVITSRRRKDAKNAGKRKSKRSFALTDDKTEDEMSFTDEEEESTMSDFSMSSNTTIGQRTSSGAARTTTREDLLSNILIGLVPTTEKTTSIDRGSEVDFEEDATDPLAIEPSAKKLTRRKKKKSSWKMGIVTTRKRKKKTAFGATSKTAQTSVEETTTETTVSRDTVKTDRSIAADIKEPTTVEKTPEKILGDNYAVNDAIVKCEDIKSLVNTDSFDIDFKDFAKLLEPISTATLKEAFANDSLSVEENKSTKMNLEAAESSNSADLTAASAATANKFFKEPPKIVYDELMAELFHRIDIKHLIDYAWLGQDKYKCLLCFFTGKNIVHHYKVSHHGREVLISRLKSTDAQAAIVDTERAATVVSSSATETGQTCKFCCRFCGWITLGAADAALEAFYEHCTTHTGEYRFHCNNCSYQAVAKASMKTHYYKICRRDKTFNESASEDVVPREAGIYGYLCRSCNYVQLKRQNVEAHVAFWHREQMDTEILKINMATSNNEHAHESAASSVNAEEPFVAETKPQVSELGTIECKAVVPLVSIARLAESEGSNENTSECILREPKTEENIQIKEESEETPKLSQGEPEGSVSTGNLSAFVCPPELENREMEIQRERQKTMREIANNIGILLKSTKSGLSIIDKLQDKMRTDAVVTPVPAECNTPTEHILEARENPSLPFESSSAEPLMKTEDIIIKEDLVSQPSSQEIRSSLTEEHVAAADKSEVTNDENDKVDVKIRDPLAIMDSCKNMESDNENSDNERSAPPIFESDSSSEQSDSEQTDVNMILKETCSTIDASSSRDPMLTTIQRLAAQLQNVKPLEPAVPSEPRLDIKTEIKSEPMSSIPQAPDVVPISNVQPSPTKQQNVKYSKKEILTPTSCKSPPQSFIKFRRLSGDMLSMPTDNQEGSQEFNTDGAQSYSAVDSLQTDAEEECSFLKIENVVSLAKPDHNESHIVSDIRRAVEISPTKSKEIPILRKPSQPLILKKNVLLQPLINSNVHALRIHPVIVSSTSLATSPSISPSTNPSTLNYRSRKIKVIRSPLSTKSKDTSVSTSSSFAVKLKSVEAYTAMLTETKLAHFYKCMGRNCSYTTDSLALYDQHYCKHFEASKQQNSTEANDYMKCAYCHASPSNWRSLEAHLWEKHSHCRYQCGYCFYRAVVPSYVQQHHTTCHPGTVLYYLLGKPQRSTQEQEDVNRKDYVKPFICKHDCDKIFYTREAFAVHLKTKHPAFQFKHKCHLCNTIHTAESLITHYKVHGFCKYQCLYCFYGAESLNEMHQHLSAFHCNRLPQVLERALPPKPNYTEEVIRQLLLRTITQEINKGSFDSNADDSKKTTTKKDATNDQISTASLNVKVASSTDTRPKPPNNLKKDLTFVGAVSTDDLKDAEVETTVDNISTNEQPAGVTLASVGEKTSTNMAEKQPVQVKSFLHSKTRKLSDHTTSQILQEPEINLSLSMNDSDAVDPLEFSGEFTCSDEFVNTNFLDNAELLKNFTPTSGNMSSKSADKTEDSDIEILESEERVAAQKNAQVEVKKTEPTVFETKAETKEQVASSDITEIKCDKSEEASANATANATANPTANATAQPEPDKPLTLDDIKDTGRTGHELYKCGYLECSFTASQVVLLKAHIKTCTLGEPMKNLFCPHCKKRFVKIGLLLEHMKTHGLKRFGCSMCKLRYPVSYQATAHMKTKHKFLNTKLVPADPTNPSVDGLFIVQAVPFGSADRRTKRRKGIRSGAEQENDKTADNEKLSFSPDEIEQLPRQAIYNREVQCAVCPYTTKVRTNIIRHLQLHAKDETVPESGPVNPVPCLDKKEKMFDKMVNLASSSHQNGRMGAKPKESIKESEEGDSIPKFIPEHKRYVCGVAECNYLTVDEAMLRYHLKALHSDEPYFRCPHCPPPQPGQENQNIAIDKMGIHLKMHDTRLYKCSHCNHHHYHSIKMTFRHVVERHLTDKHPEKRPFVKVVREIENTETVQQPVQEETEEEVPDPDGNHWKCNLCDFKCVYKADVVNHADTAHGENSQYKCTLCSFKTNGKVLVEQHINSKHALETTAAYTMIYQRIKGVNKRTTEAVEQGGQDEPFDTTPLWLRNMPRVRHIRGILLEEEIETSSETSPAASPKVSLGKRKSDAEIVTKPAKIKSTGKSTSLDDNNKQSKEKSKRSLSCDKLSGEAEGDTGNNKSAKDSKTDAGELSDINDPDMGRFGPYGKPDANMYVCTLCNHFKTKYKHDMRDHLYRELNYPRWHCKTCGYLSINRKALLQHFGKRHNGENPAYEPLSPDNTIEYWVMTLLKKQTDMIKASSHNVNVANRSVVATPVSPDVSSVKRLPDKKTVNLAPTISNLQNDILEDSNKSTIDTDDGDSRDNEDLVIDMKEDEMHEDRSNDADMFENDKLGGKTDDNLERPIACKHCQHTFNRQRGFKMHVQYSHLKLFGFLCPYCDRSSNSEPLLRQHIRAKHPNDPENIIRNPNASVAKLPDEFWEKEYGLYPIKGKRRKLNTENNASNNVATGQSATSVPATAFTNNHLERCDVCNFTAVNYTGLKSHMRTHATLKHNLKCLYCTYSCIFKAEMVEHWKINHPSLPLKFKELTSAAGSSSGETKSKPSTPQKRDVDGMLKSTGEERETSTIIYGCFYCDLRSISLSSIRQHWNLMHKELKGSEATSNVKLPFRYKEIPVPKFSSTTSAKKNVNEQAKQTENLSPVTQRSGWVCQWCQEFCQTNNDRMRHQNMFHSHLPHKWQEQQQQQQQQQQQKEHDQLQGSSTRVPADSADKYAGSATNSKTAPNFKTVVENLRTKHARHTELGDTKNEDDQNLLGVSKRDRGDDRLAVARKSTTKSVVLCTKSSPRVFKAVARKSTNPRYPPTSFTPRLPAAQSINTGLEEEEEIQREPLSHYGRPSSPINLAELSTYMVVGGLSMRVNCHTLATLIDIKPEVLVKDVRKDPEYASLSNLD
ncbi:uncharacterized protein LOC143906882 isoform X2 [Temnothorax americanus]|uniref:uncharacterized protein LOC143906882 isoform X2 n=1 Tax=Temnothorax americanus TaxID=1964332 RepID=UPI004068340B